MIVRNLVVFMLGFILFSLLSLSVVSAVSLDLSGNYSKGETMIGKISGNILEPVEREDIEFYRGHVLVPLDFDLEKIGDDWYIWAIAPENENNYSILINDIVTTKQGKVVKENFQQNFSVSEEYIDYNVKPGVVIARDSFEIEIFSYVDEDQVISIGFLEESKDYEISPGMNEIELSLEDLEEGFIEFSVGEYLLPGYIIGGGNSGGSDSLNEVRKVRFRPRYLESTILVGSRGRVYPFEIVNEGEEELVFVLEYDEDIFDIEPKGSVNIASGFSGNFNLTLKKDLDEEISAVIVGKTGDLEVELPVEILVTENEEEEQTEYIEESVSEESFYTCSELKGLKCVSGEECNGKTVDSLDGDCCLVGSCVAPESGGDYAWVGWALGVVVILILGWAFYKYKKAKPSVNKIPKSGVGKPKI